ncbi:MAG: SMI1/KNR4 family protein [Gemmataceae bacterium]
MQQLGYQDPMVITWADVSAWEGKFGVELPSSLAQALVVQNGGRLLGTEIDILPIQRFGTLDQGEWVGLLRKELPSPSDRALMIYVGWLPGGRAILDYRRHREPRVRNMDPIFDGELRREYSSFDEVVRLSRKQRAGA